MHHQQQQQQHPHAVLGVDTFRGPSAGSLGAGGSRPLFFGKTMGEMELARSGLLKVASPISGATLTVPDGAGPHHHASIRDPLTGTVLALGRQAQVVTPVLSQPQVGRVGESCKRTVVLLLPSHRAVTHPSNCPAQVYSRRFFLTKDVDIAIATLRATNTVKGGSLNEKIGTSGSATGMAWQHVLVSVPLQQQVLACAACVPLTARRSPRLHLLAADVLVRCCAPLQGLMERW